MNPIEFIYNTVDGTELTTVGCSKLIEKVIVIVSRYKRHNDIVNLISDLHNFDLKDLPKKGFINAEQKHLFCDTLVNIVLHHYNLACRNLN